MNRYVFQGEFLRGDKLKELSFSSPFGKIADVDGEEDSVLVVLLHWRYNRGEILLPGLRFHN
jgi:hypothetical protein